MTDILVSIKGHLAGLTKDNDLVLREPTTNANHYVPRGLYVNRIVKLTQAAYDALSPPSATTLYLIVG